MGSDFLFSMPSRLKGAARVLDIGGQLDDYNRSETPEEADALGILSDLLVVMASFETTKERASGSSSK